MKKFKILLISGFLLTQFVACKKCFECTKTEFGVTQKEEECNEDLINKLEDAGFDCSKEV